MNEIWKVTTVNCDYEVSNFGRVKSNKRNKVRVLKPFFRGKKGNGDSDNYLSVALCCDGTQKTYPVHRLVAMAFIPNPNELPQVNHINGIKTDNRVCNLEWCDNSYNIWHSYNILGNTHGQEIPVCQYYPNGEFIKEWRSAALVEKELGIDSSSIRGVCKKQKNRKLAGGFLWRYKEDKDLNFTYNKTSKVVQISKYGERLKTFDSIKDASIEVGVTEGGITGVCMKRNRGYNYAGGFLWRYENEYNDNEFGYYLNKTFIQMTCNNIFIAEYKGTVDLVEHSGCELVKVIMCCKGERTSTNGFKWCIKEECDKTRETKREKKVVKLTKDFTFVCEFNSVNEASKEDNIHASNISFSCKHKGKYRAGKFKWMFKDDYIKYLNKEKY